MTVGGSVVISILTLLMVTEGRTAVLLYYVMPIVMHVCMMHAPFVLSGHIRYVAYCAYMQ